MNRPLNSALMRCVMHQPSTSSSYMAIIDQITAPLVLRNAEGKEKVIAACFQHPQGLLYLDLFWHQSSPDRAAHLLQGKLCGEGPWRIGDYRLRLLGCNHTDPHLQDEFGEWQNYLQNHGDEYPPRTQIIEIARRLGANPQLV